MATPVQHSFGWRPDGPDHRDYYLVLPRMILPDSVDLRDGCPKVKDQLSLGSCVPNAVSTALEYDAMKQKLGNIFAPSRLFLYYGARTIEHTEQEDSGSTVRDGLKSAAKFGYCSEVEWPYDVSKYKTKPSEQVYHDAKPYRGIQYQRVVQYLASLQTCLANGFPFVFGITVYESFMSVDSDGIVPLPAKTENILGYHCLIGLGYQQAGQHFVVQNSWGEKWGDKGYAYFPYAYLTDADLSASFWMVTHVKGV